jgi:hypothetical protein
MMKRRNQVPRGAYCDHRRMRFAKCEFCAKPCAVECPDCGLGWMLYEGDLGYYVAKGESR